MNEDPIRCMFRDIAREVYAELSGGLPVPDPELITVAQFIKSYGVSKDAAYKLAEDAPANGFPAVRLGPGTIRIDKRRLNQWIATGGLGAKV